jgi:hypothetical protein
VPVPAAAVKRISTKYLGSEVAAKVRVAWRDKVWKLMRVVPERTRAYDHRDEPMLMEPNRTFPGPSVSLLIDLLQ